MAFNDTFRESIQTKHIANVGFTTTAKGVSNETIFTKNPHQVLASQIPAVDVVGTYGDFVADGITAGLVEKHIVKLTSDPSVNSNMAWFATEDNCTEAGHSARGTIRLTQWMRYTNTEYKLRLFEDTGSNAPDYTAEIFPSETAFNWEYDASAGIVYFDEDPSANGKTLPLWAEIYTYIGASVEAGLGATTSGIDDVIALLEDHHAPDSTDHDDRYYTEIETDILLTTLSGNIQNQLDGQDEFIELSDTISSYNEGRILFESDSAVVDSSDFIYRLAEQTLEVPNIVTSGNVTVSGTFGFDQTTTVDSITTTVDISSTANQLPTANAVYSTISTVSGALQNEIDQLDSDLTETIVWEVVDTPFEQIRPKIAHQGKAIYTYGSLTIGGDLTVSGTTTTIHSEELTVADKIITVNDGEVGAGITGERYAGIEVDRGTEENYLFVYDEVENNFRVGISGSLQAVATREDTPTDQYVAFWNASEYRFDTAGGILVSDIASETFVGDAITSLSGVLQSDIDDVISDLSNNYYTITQLDNGQLDNRYYTETEIDNTITVLSGTLRSDIDQNTSDISDLDIKTTTASGYLQNQIDSLDDVYATDAELTAVSGTLQTQVDQNTSDITSNYNTLNNYVSSVSGTLQTQITDNYVALDDKIDTTSGTLQSAIDSLGEARDEFIELTDTISEYNAGRILFESSAAVVDDADLFFGENTLFAPNLFINGDTALSGTLSFVDDDEIYINSFITSVNSSSTDEQVPTGKAVYDFTSTAITTVSGLLQGELDSLESIVTNNYNTLDSKIDTTSGTLQSALDDLDTSLTDAIIWEVVDTPSDQIRPKIAHQGKAIYTAGNLTIGGDLTVSGTTTTIHSEELTVTDKVITVNAGEVGAGITGSQYAGIEVDRGSETDYLFVFDEVQDNFRVGISGSLQAVATREDTPTNNYIAFWNASAIRFDTAGGLDVNDIATENFVTTAITTLSGVLQSDIDDAIADLANNYYNKTELDSGQLDNRYYTETELDLMLSTISGSISGDLNNYYTKSEIDTQFTSYYTSSQTDSAISSALSSYYTSAQVDSLLSGLTSEFIELTDVEISSYNDGRVLFTTASGVTDSAALTFDTVSGTLNTTSIKLGLGGYADEFVSTVSSGTTHTQIPSAKAVWDLTVAVTSTNHTHYDIDAVYVSDTEWTCGTGFSALPDGLVVFVNGVKQRIGSTYDCTVAVVSEVITITFNYSVRTSDWVNVIYYDNA